jgi:Calx-beta domain-containing protein
MEKPKRTPPSSNRPVQSEGSDAWRLDPSDVARHAQLRRRNEQVGPLGKAVRYSALVLASAGAVAVYWNFDALRQVTVEAPALSALFKKPSPDDAANRANGTTGNATVESSAIVGTAAPTSVSTARDREPPVEVAKVEEHAAPAPKPREAPVPERPAATPSASAAESVATTESVATAPAPVVEQPPARPPQPERIGFALPKFTASERDAFAAVIVAREGGNRGQSVFTWWTSDGTAKAGSDYVDLGKVVVKFAAGEANRTLHIPIVGDEIPEGPESFYVNLAPGDDPSAEAQDRVEVVIEDDDKP